MDLNALKAAMADATIAALSDADAAAALSTPTLTPKAVRITYTNAGASTSLGAIKAITLRATLLGVIAANNALSPAAGYVHELLSGNGFDATDPAVPALAAQFVAANVLSQADANTLLYDIRYAAGGPVTAEDVAAARVADGARQQLMEAWAGKWNAFVAGVDAGRVNTDADARAIFGA